MGIDGLAIKVNGIFVSTKQDIDELVELNKQISIEFLLSSRKTKINSTLVSTENLLMVLLIF